MRTVRSRRFPLLSGDELKVSSPAGRSGFGAKKADIDIPKHGIGDFEGWRLIRDRYAASRPQRFSRFDAGALFLPPPIWKTT